VRESTAEQDVSTPEHKPTSLPRVRLRPVQLAKAVTAAVSFAATATALIFGVWPALKPDDPPVTKAATLTNVTLDRMTFGQYLDRIAQSHAGYRRPQLERAVAVVGLDFNIKGYRQQHLPLQWRIVDARTGDQLDQSRDLFLTPEAREDQARWSVWVPVPRGRDRRFFIEVELLDDRGVVPLGQVRSDYFGGV
jgi:hypothetical protein